MASNSQVKSLESFILLKSLKILLNVTNVSIKCVDRISIFRLSSQTKKILPPQKLQKDLTEQGNKKRGINKI